MVQEDEKRKTTKMTPQEQLEQAGAKYVNEADITMFDGQDELLIAEHHFYQGGLKGMEIQKEIDRQEIERLKTEIKKLKEMLLDDIAVFGIADSLNPGVLPTRASNMEANLKSMGYEI
jgi:hypothetical protein